MVDIRNEVVKESVRKLMNECMKCPSLELEYDVYGPGQELVDPEQLRRLAALNSAMRRIISSAKWN